MQLKEFSLINPKLEASLVFQALKDYVPEEGLASRHNSISSEFDAIFALRKQEADKFYQRITSFAIAPDKIAIITKPLQSLRLNCCQILGFNCW